MAMKAPSERLRLFVQLNYITINYLVKVVRSTYK